MADTQVTEPAVCSNDEAYCLNCTMIVGIADARNEPARNGYRMIRGACSECGTPVFKLLPREH
jgi:hypothetical protein